MKTMRTTITAACVLIAGCAGQQVVMTPEDQRSLSSQPLYAVHYEAKGGFLVESTGHTAMALLVTPLVALTQVAEGNELRTQLALEDPVLRSKERLVKVVQSGLDLTQVRSIPKPQEGDAVASIKRAYGDGVLLDVRTTRWGIHNNRAKYQARARLVRLADSRVLWEAACNEVVAGKDAREPTREEISANNGALLKAKLGEAAELCADQLAAWLVGK
jgi:hypothetical protein